MKAIRLFGLSLLAVFILTSLLRTQDGHAQTSPAAPADSPQSAVSPAKAALAEELLGLLHMEETIDISMDKMLGIQKSMNPQNLPAEAQAQQAKVMEAVLADVKKVINWKTIKNDYIQIYANAFTEDELRGLVAFFKSPLGQTYVQKQPEIQEALMQKMQGLMAQLIPQIQASAQKIMAEHTAAPQASPSASAAP